MHSFRHFKSDIVFHFNPDLSGPIKIVLPDNQSLEVSGDAVVDFIAEFVRNQKIRVLENMSTNDVLGIK